MINILVKGNCEGCLHFYSSRRTAELPYSTQHITTCTEFESDCVIVFNQKEPKVHCIAFSQRNDPEVKFLLK